MRVPVAVAAVLLLAAAGCEDVRRYSGVWAGEVAGDPGHRVGFSEAAVLRATIGAVTRGSLEATLDVPDQPGALRFEAMEHAAGDVLGELRLPGEPLRTYLGWLRPPGAEPFLAVISLYPEDRIDARIIRGPSQVYGVFVLRRIQAAAN